MICPRPARALARLGSALTCKACAKATCPRRAPGKFSKPTGAGRRSGAWTGRVIGAQLGRTLDRIPPAYRAARGFHLGVHPDEPDLGFIRQLRALGPRAAGGRPPVISLETWKPADRPPADAALRQLCSAADIFSPNLAEAQSLVGPGAPDELARRLADAGARIVALRMGAQGSLVCSRHRRHAARARRAGDRSWTRPARAMPIAARSWPGTSRRAMRRLAGCYGAVAASFLVEQIGPPPLGARLRDEAAPATGAASRQICQAAHNSHSRQRPLNVPPVSQNCNTVLPFRHRSVIRA